MDDVRYLRGLRVMGGAALVEIALAEDDVDAAWEAAGADTRRYPTIARRLTLIRDLETHGDRPDEFDDYLAAIRDTYGRRPSLMAAIDRAGLWPRRWRGSRVRRTRPTRPCRARGRSARAWP